MAAHLRQKDLLVVGFWSDWTYLNGLLGEVLDGISPVSVTVVDPSPLEDLKSKAKDLWDIANGPEVIFNHVRESGADVLDELRRAFSINYLKQVLAAGSAAFAQVTGSPCDPALSVIADFDSETLYDLRRDAEGVPSGKPARTNRPDRCELLGMFHLLLRQAGAAQTPQGYSLAGKSIRVVNGAGKMLSLLQAEFAEAPVLPSSDLVVAPGADDLPLPANTVRNGTAGSFMRPAPVAKWLGLQQARMELGI